MGFYIGILIKSSPPKGGVHKLMILLRDLPKEFLRKFFGEEMGGVRGTQTPSLETSTHIYDNLNSRAGWPPKGPIGSSRFNRPQKGTNKG